ncbi:hypothetical protein AB0L85_27280 [Streptomyces sp. NPDC052051]|uniref:hypothetical protein n=1 Tax=Streptomyces sp. NPDC052051 TaxID=3154649 RepID=UPI003444DBD2
MASDRNAPHPELSAFARADGGHGRAAAARRRSPRPRVEVSVNALNGTMSWRTIKPGAASGKHEHPTGERRDATLTARAQAAAFRSAGLDPARARARGAAPVPTDPATVRAALSAPVESLSPDQLNSYMARVGALRSQVAGDLGRGAHMPKAAAARLRSAAVSPGGVHDLTAAHTASAHMVGQRAGTAAHPGLPSTGPAPAPGPRR